MSKILLNGFCLGVLISMLSVLVFAQSGRTDSKLADLYVVSAKAGGVNHLEGTVTIIRANGKTGVLLKRENVEIGDKVITGADGRAEILLNPGSYIRLSPNSEFEFISTSLEDLRLKLTKGGAILEIFADKEFPVLVNTPNTQFLAIKTGVYRIDVNSEASSRLEVWEGRAMANSMEVRGGRAATVSNGETSVEKFDRDKKDDFELWSKNRARSLVKMNQSLERRTLGPSLLFSFNSGVWSIHNSFGLWLTHPSFYDSFCFLPFGTGWVSPYNYFYYWNLWNSGFPVYSFPFQINSGQTGSGNTIRNNDGGSGNGTGSDPNTTGGTRTNPPYMTIQNDIGNGTRNPRNPAFDVDFPSPQTQPQSVPQTPVIIVKPPSSRDNTGSRNP